MKKRIEKLKKILKRIKNIEKKNRKIKKKIKKIIKIQYQSFLMLMINKDIDESTNSRIGFPTVGNCFEYTVFSQLSFL